MGHARIGRLAVPGASLYYEVRGRGPVLLLISTGNGDAALYAPLADVLCARYTVVSYDRRGFSRSPVRVPVADGERLAADVEDARRLLDQVALEPAYVFGACSGAIVGLALLQHRPDRVRRLVAHEPPLVSVLPDSAHWLDFHAELYRTYRTAGLLAARDIFRAYVGSDGRARPAQAPAALPAEAPAALPAEAPAALLAEAPAALPAEELAALRARLRDNQVYWFEHELLTYPAHRPDLAALAAGRVVLAAGATSRAHFSARPAAVLAERIGAELALFPGGHVGHQTHPRPYADVLTRWLDRG